MIIYGNRASKVAQESLFIKCPSCGHTSTLTLYVYRKYAHVFWIPFFPIGKTGYCECSHCNRVWKEEQMPDTINQSYHDLAKQAKRPWWMFAGVGLIAILVTAGVINGQAKDARNKKLILDPQKGDVYEVKLNSKSYTLYKVVDVARDTAFLEVNEYETDKQSGLDRLKDKPYSEGLQVGISKTALKSMLDRGEILDINR